MNNTDLFQRFSQEFTERSQDESALVCILTWPELWAVFSCLQLALRHPKNTGPTAQVAERVTRQFQQMLAPDPESALAQVAEMGWDAEYDKL